jgi:hypothetical protein
MFRGSGPRPHTKTYLHIRYRTRRYAMPPHAQICWDAAHTLPHAQICYATARADMLVCVCGSGCGTYATARADMLVCVRGSGCGTYATARADMLTQRRMLPHAPLRQHTHAYRRYVGMRTRIHTACASASAYAYIPHTKRIHTHTPQIFGTAYAYQHI